MDTLYTFWDNRTHYNTESVNFLGLMNSATKSLRAWMYGSSGLYARLQVPFEALIEMLLNCFTRNQPRV